MLNGEKLIERPLRWGMVGGGRTGQVGYKHRTGALRDNTAYKMVCGAFDLDVQRGKDFGIQLGVDEGRLYPDYKTLIPEEAKRKDILEAACRKGGTRWQRTCAVLRQGYLAPLHFLCSGGA